MRFFPLSRSWWAAFLFIGIAGSQKALGASFHLPDAYEHPSLRIVCSQEKQGSLADLAVGGSAAAGNNLGSLWDITDYERRAGLFGGDSAFAQVAGARWIYARAGGWWLGVGSGWIDSYVGNQDAAQLWLDLHSGVETKTYYLPDAHLRKMSLDWIAFGRSFSFELQGLRTTIDIGIRHLQSERYEELALEGWVSGDQFAGPLTRLYSDSANGSEGRGWCVDAAAELRTSDWRACVQVEGLVGRISWNGLTLDSGYLTSPRVFTDAEGFLRDLGGGFSGVTSRRGLAGSIDPRVKLTIAGGSGTVPLVSAEFRKGDKPSVSVGVTRSCGNRHFVYLSYYPATKMGEVAFGNSRLKLRLCSDSWFFRNPKYARAEVSFVLP